MEQAVLIADGTGFGATVADKPRIAQDWAQYSLLTMQWGQEPRRREQGATQQTAERAQDLPMV